MLPTHRPPQARTEALNFGRLQVDYALGRMGRSYVAGFGTNPPLRVRSLKCWSHCSGPG